MSVLTDSLRFGSDIVATSTRPWAPFALGFGFGVASAVWALYDGSWRMRHNAGPKWEFDSEYARAWVAFKQMNWRWSVLLGGPFVLGAVVWVLWFVLSLLAGVLAV